MGFKKGEGGRPCGAKNKATVAAKTAIALAAEGLGGAKRLVEWAKSDPVNERAFWTQVFPRLVPHEIAGEGGSPLIPPGTAIQFIVTPLPGAENRT